MMKLRLVPLSKYETFRNNEMTMTTSHHFEQVLTRVPNVANGAQTCGFESFGFHDCAIFVKESRIRCIV